MNDARTLGMVLMVSGLDTASTSSLASLGESILFGINGVRNQRSHLVGPPFPEFKANFSATAGWHFPRDLTRHLFANWWVWSESRILLSLAEILGAVLSPRT